MGNILVIPAWDARVTVSQLNVAQDNMHVSVWFKGGSILLERHISLGKHEERDDQTNNLDITATPSIKTTANYNHIANILQPHYRAHYKHITNTYGCQYQRTLILPFDSVP